MIPDARVGGRLPGDDIDCASKIIGDGREVDLDGGLGETAPSHAAQSIASFPRAKNLLDPSADTMDTVIPCLQARHRLFFVTSPHSRRRHPDAATPAAHGFTEIRSPIGSGPIDMSGRM